MSPTIIPRDQVAQRLAVTTRALLRYENRGLVRVLRDGEVEGYPADQVHRIWTIVTLQRDLGVNLAGVEAILHLRGQLHRVHARLHEVVAELDRAFDAADGPGPDA